MSSLRSRLDRLERSAPLPALNWNNFAATHLDEIVPDASGIDWPALSERTTITDVCDALVALLPPKPLPPSPPDVVPSPTTGQEPAFPVGYVCDSLEDDECSS